MQRRNADTTRTQPTGDAPVLSAAQSQIRNEFRQRSTLSDTESVQAAVQHADEVARVLRENVVQGQRADGDEHSYSTSFPFSLVLFPTGPRVPADGGLT